MANDKYPMIRLENVRMMFKNFKGSKTKFNAEGKRNFCIVLTEEQAIELLAIGFNVKYLEPRDEGDERIPYLKANVNYNGFKDPVVHYYTYDEDDLEHYVDHVLLNPDSVGIIDDIKPYYVDVKINGSPYEDMLTTYLDTLYVSVIRDPLESKYVAKEQGSQEAICIGDDCPVTY